MHGLQQFQRSLLNFLPTSGAAMQFQRSADDVTHRLQVVERGKRVLEDHLHLPVVLNRPDAVRPAEVHRLAVQ